MEFSSEGQILEFTRWLLVLYSMNNCKYSHPPYPWRIGSRSPALTLTTCYIMNKSHKHNISHKKPDMKEYTLWFHLYKIQNHAKLVMSEVRNVAVPEAGMTGRGKKRFLAAISWSRCWVYEFVQFLKISSTCILMIGIFFLCVYIYMSIIVQ